MNGAIVHIGQVPGELVAGDPSGRYVVAWHAGELAVYDADNGLSRVMSCPQTEDPAAVTVQPDGRCVAVDDSAGLRLHAADGTVRRADTGGFDELAFSADGVHLACGSARWDEPP